MKRSIQSQEYDFSESEDSPLKAYRPLNKVLCSAEEEPGLPKCADSDIDTDSHPDTCSTLQDITTDSNNHSTQTIDPFKTDVTVPEHASKVVGASGDCPKPTSLRRNVVYMHSQDLVQKCDQMLKIPNRASLIACLIEAYTLHNIVRVLEPVEASFDELCTFHSADYLKFLRKLSDQDDTEKYDDEAQVFGLSYDCPAHTGVYEYTTLVAGATLQAAQCLLDQSADVAINWFGGWHHGKKDSASGFCYTNDAVLGILRLREKFNRVLYIDLDLHHGDGVEDAFCSTNKVMTVSVHKHDVGFFPGTGCIKDIGYGKGKYYSVNIPLKDGVKDAEFSVLVFRVLLKVKDKFNPDVIVCQCGADGLVGDPMESFNLTPRALAKCVYTLLSWKLPMLLLGGGGYHFANTARCWAYLTAVVVGKKLPSDIPDHKFLMEYGPDYSLELEPGNKRNQNTQEYMQAVYSEILHNLSSLP